MPKTVKGLVGDVGGTHARFAVASAGAGRPRIAQVKVFKASDYETGHAAFRAYCSGLSGDAPQFAVVAAAGPIHAGEVVFTNNTAWRFNEAAIAKEGGLKGARLINDFTAQALAIDILEAKDLRRLGPTGAPDAKATAAILGPGTGFGAAALVADGHGRAVLTCEGGHASFAPADDVELEIVRRLMARYGRVSVERVLSGPGLLNLYQTLCEIEGRKAACDQPDAVTHAGLAGDADAAAALNRFCAILGSVAGDLALTYGARRGVYISGGIAPDIFDFLAASDFRARFEAKGRMSDYVRAIPTFVVTQPFAALLGAATLLPEMEAAA
jgi:glucokinase